MAFTTKIITDTSPDFGDNPQVIIESGKPEYVEVDNLFPNTDHWVKAELWQDNTLEDTSNVKTFTTLPAGTITLEYIQTTRSGYGYDVTYRYTSTYAPSSAILATNGTQFQGFINGEQHTVSFWVTGLTAGLAYLTNVTLWDIYTESVTVTGSIVTTVVNEIRITDTTPSETSVVCELDYVIDSGFYEGYVEYWLATQDPATEQAEGYTYFVDGADSVTIAGLTAGTAYLFRATILLGDGTTEIHSSVVSASTTTHDYSREYFTITNESNTNNQIYIVAENHGALTSIDYSTNNGSTWKSVYSESGNGTLIANLGVGQKVLLRHSGTMAVKINDTYYANYFRSTGDISLSGNINSLLSMASFYPITREYYPSFSFYRLFMNGQVVSAKNLYFGNIPLKENAMNSIFRSNARLVDVPDLSGISSVERMSMYMAFAGCPIQKGANLRNIRTVGDRGLQSIYENCSYLSEAYAPSVSSWNTSNMNNWLNGVSATGVVYKPSTLSIPTGLKSGVPSGWTTEDYA